MQLHTVTMNRTAIDSLTELPLCSWSLFSIQSCTTTIASLIVFLNSFCFFMLGIYQKHFFWRIRYFFFEKRNTFLISGMWMNQEFFTMAYWQDSCFATHSSAQDWSGWGLLTFYFVKKLQPMVQTQTVLKCFVNKSSKLWNYSVLFKRLVCHPKRCWRKWATVF